MAKIFDLEAEMRDFAARRDITDAVHRYMRGLDRLDPALLQSAFTADAFVDCGLMAGDGAEFVTFAQGFLSGLEASHHMLGQIRIELHDDASASGECYFQAWHASRDEAGHARHLFIAGRYIDEYACNNGEWRIRRRHLITDWVKDDPADHAFFAANPATNRGGRGGEDFSQIRNWPC